MIWPISDARAEIKKCFHSFLVQMKTSKSHYEIDWTLLQTDIPLKHTLCELLCISQWSSDVDERKKHGCSVNVVDSIISNVIIVPHYLSWKTPRAFWGCQGRRRPHGEGARFINLSVHIDATLGLSCLKFMPSCLSKAALAKLP